MSDLSILSEVSSPYIVIQTTHSPYSSSAAIDAIDAAFAATNIGQSVVYVFAGDGVFQLTRNQ
jgi:tRNA 2-thiouridine synthesizing protein C